MPRDGSGNYTLPPSNPVATGQDVEASWANDTMNDLSAEMQDSLSRSGKGGMLADFDANVLSSGSTTSRALSTRFDEVKNVKDYGAIGNGSADDTAAVNAAIDAVVATGGILYFPPGTYKHTGNGGPWTITKPIQLKGAAWYTSEISHSGDNTCLAFNAGTEGGASFDTVKVTDLRITGNDGVNAVGLKFSDMWGSEVRNCQVDGYRAGSAINLHNDYGWTEGFIIAHSQLRNNLNGIHFSRDSTNGGTNSFMGFTAIQLGIALDLENAAGLYADSNNNIDNSIFIYQSDIDIPCWHASEDTTKRVIHMGDHSVLTRSRVFIRQDGLFDFAGNEGIMLHTEDGGIINVTGYIQAGIYDVSAYPSGTEINQFGSVCHNDPYTADYEAQPYCRLNGAEVHVKAVAQSANKVFIIGKLAPMSSYEAKLTVDGPGIAFSTRYIISTHNKDYIADVDRLGGQAMTNFYCQPFENRASGSYLLDGGLQFELQVNSATQGGTYAWRLEIEML